MIFPVLLIALLCAEAASDDTLLLGCDVYACFVPPSCLEGRSETELITDLPTVGSYPDPVHHPKIKDTCSGFMMIRPASTNRWKVIIGWTNPATTGVTVFQGQNELFSCKNTTHNGEYIGLKARSGLPDFNETLPTPETLFYPEPFTCQFFVGNGKTEIFQKKYEKIKIVSRSPEEESDLNDDKFIQSVTSKVTCDFTKVQFDPIVSPEDAVEPATVNAALLSCYHFNEEFKLQVKIGSVYEDVLPYGLACEKNSSTLQHEYRMKTKSGEYIRTAEFYARCYARRCSVCGKAYVSTPKGKIAPTFATGDDGCQSYTCPKFFRVDSEPTFDKPECTRGRINDWHWKWTIGSMRLSAVSTDCVDRIFCKEINQSSCTGDCKLNPNTTYPYCPENLALSAKIDGEELRGIGQIECHNHEGRLYYSGKVNGYFPRDPSNVTFSCIAKPATSFYRTTLFRDIFSAVAGVCIMLCFPMLYACVWLIREIRKLLIERWREAKNAQKTAEKTPKTAEKMPKTTEKTAKK